MTGTKGKAKFIEDTVDHDLIVIAERAAGCRDSGETTIPVDYDEMGRITLEIAELRLNLAQERAKRGEGLDLTADEAALIRQMRAWTDGIPEEAIGKGKESVVYISLLAARAELYQISLRGELDAVRERYDRMHKLISPGLIIRLCKAWEDLQSRKREDEEREIEETE